MTRLAYTDDVIVYNGKRISIAEVENVLHRHEATAEAAVVPMPHDRLGESPCAFVVVRKGMTMATMREEMEAHCRKGMAWCATVPLRVVFVVELPRTPSGTVRKAMLRVLARRLKRAEDQESSSGAPAAASAEVAVVAGRRRVKIGGKEEGI